MSSKESIADRLLLNGGTGWTAGTPAAAHKYPVFLVSGNPYNATTIAHAGATVADDVLILIPARMASTRLPGKPLADIAGLPMIVQVLRRAEAARLGPVVVACDDETIATAVEKAGGRAIMTRADHPSGSDRIFEALGVVDPEGRAKIVVNVQGDLPTLAPADLAAALTPLTDPAVDIATLCAEIKKPEERTNPERGQGGGRSRSPRDDCAHFISPAPPRLRATGRSTITSGFTPIAARHWNSS